MKPIREYIRDYISRNPDCIVFIIAVAGFALVHWHGW